MKQTVIITGASSGIGLATTKYFLDRGDNVVMNSTTLSKLEEAYHSLGANDNLAMVAGDISDKATGQELAAKAIAQFGSIDVLVNNAGIFEARPFLEVDEAYLDRFINTNLKGAFFTTQAVIPQMQQQGSGVVINIGTPLVYHMFGGMPVTAPLSAKGGLHALTISLAAEFGKQNIRVNLVAPGNVRTPLQRGNADKRVGQHLLNKVGEPEQIAQMVYTVAKNDFITGAVINVDGGMGAGVHLQ
jgi:NAD(P)-dependent dehydrogenase (short-subunit alcohol dehydrogenase family)